MAKVNFDDVRSFQTRLGEVCHLRERRSWAEKPIKRIDENDIKLFVLEAMVRSGMGVGALAAVCRALPLRSPQRSRKNFMKGLQLFFRERSEAQISSILDDHERAGSRQQMSYALCSRETWRPILRVENRRGLETAAAKGRGAILWVENFLSHTTMGKRSLHDDGIAASHLSVPMHGFPDTRFGRKVHHRRQVEIENRYVEERIVFDPSGESPRDRITAKLQEGKSVLITNNAFAGRRIVDIPLTDKLRFDIAAGPISLALKTGAALLPVATLELQPLSEYTTFVGPDLTEPGAASGDDRMGEMAIGYRDWLVPIIRSYPCQWKQWARVREDDPRRQAPSERVVSGSPA